MNTEKIDYSKFQSRNDEKQSRKLFSELAKSLSVQKSTIEVMAAQFVLDAYKNDKLCVDIVNKRMSYLTD